MAFLKQVFLFLLILLSFLSAQTEDITIVLPNTSDSTQIQEKKDDSLNLEIEYDNEAKKSVWGPSFLNLALPGTGHFYLGDYKKGAAYLAADLTLWLGFAFSLASSHRTENSAMSYARTYAHTNSSYDYDNHYWSYLSNSNFMSSEEYNEAQANNRAFDQMYLGDDAWQWDSKENQEAYSETRSSAKNWKTTSSIILGALFLNRVVSFVDGRISAQRYNNAQMKVVPVYSLETKEVGMVFLMSF